jgi:hypothetical protein
MDLKTIKKLIRRSVDRQLSEAAARISSPPEDFFTFRVRFGRALKTAGAPADLVSEASKDIHEGPVFEAMWTAWSGIESETRGLCTKERIDAWPDLVEFYVREAVAAMSEIRSESLCSKALIEAVVKVF